MSRAFVSEAAEEAASAVLTERPVTPGANPVTRAGLARMDAEIARLMAALAEVGSEDATRPMLARDLRYWRERRSTAVVMPVITDSVAVAFGVRVTIRRDGHDENYRIVGEDEADPRHGLLNWASPLARALSGAIAGDEIELPGRMDSVIVVQVEPS